MKVLHIVRPAEGGMKNHVLSLVKHLDKTQYHPVLACSQGGEWQSALFDSGIEVVELPLKGEISPLSDMHNILKLIHIIKERHIGIVHTHGMKAGLVGRTAAVLTRRCGICFPYIVATVHNSIYHYPWPEYQKRLISSVQKYLVRHTDQFITVSQALKEEIMLWEGVKEENIRVIHNGIPVDSFQKKNSPSLKIRLGLNPLLPVVGTVARLAPQKGVDLFIRAAFLVSQVIDDVQFLVVGDGPLKKELRHEVEKLGLRDRMVFVGYYPEISEIYPLMDVFVVPSLSEGLSITTIEAMASRRPIVATAVGGIPELITHRQTGFLVPPEDHQALAHGILELLKRPKWAERLSASAWQKAQTQFTVEKMVSQTEELYREISEGWDITGAHRRYAHA